MIAIAATASPPRSTAICTRRFRRASLCHSDGVGQILVVDDEQSMREFLAICLRRAGHTVMLARSADDALAQVRAQPFDIVVTDLKMPGELDGIGILKAIKSHAVPLPSDIDPEVVLVTAYATAQTALAAMKEGAY